MSSTAAEQRHPLNLRTTAAVHAELTAAALANGRSLTKEAQERVEQSLTLDRRLGGPELRKIAYVMASAFGVAGQLSAGSGVPSQEWLGNPAAVGTAIASVVDALVEHLELGDHELDQVREAIASRLLTRRAMRSLR